MMNWKFYIRESTQLILSKDSCLSSNFFRSEKEIWIVNLLPQKGYVYMLRMDTSNSTEKRW